MTAITNIKISDHDLEKAIWWGAFAAISQWTEEGKADSGGITRPSDSQLCREVVDKGVWTADSLLGFARRYSVQQGYINDNKDGNRAKRLDDLARVISQIYTKQPAPTIDTLASRWWEGVLAVQEVFKPQAEKRGLKQGPLLRSFCMKTLWYYYPDIATMWDSFAVKGLNLIEGKNHKVGMNEVDEAKAFLQDFERLYTCLEPEITQALEIAQRATGVIYPYKRRVLDKALWYVGAPTMEDQEKAWDLEICRTKEILKVTSQTYEFAAWAGRKISKD